MREGLVRMYESENGGVGWSVRQKVPCANVALGSRRTARLDRNLGRFPERVKGALVW